MESAGTSLLGQLCGLSPKALHVYGLRGFDCQAFLFRCSSHSLFLYLLLIDID